MGGKALGFETVRLPKDLFLEVQTYAVSTLSEKFDTIYPTVWYKSKDSFGDLDLIVPRPVPVDILEWLQKKFNSKKVVFNGDSLLNAMSVSFDYNDFQIDLIFIHPDNLDIALFYYSYNDLNNYVGRVAAQFGMKFGFNGLFYETVEEDILISKNPEKIYTFLGFNYSKYLQGFETLEDTFQYVIFSKYFNSEIYQIENLNNINRTRNLKRPNYHKFLQYLIDNNIAGGYEYPSKEDAILKIDLFFPEANLPWKLQQNHNRKIRLEKIKSFLNSEIVKEFLKLDDWKMVRQTLDKIFTIPDIDRILVGLKQHQLEELITAAFQRSLIKENWKKGDAVVFRTNDNHYVNAKIVDVENDHCLLQTTEHFFYKIKNDRINIAEKWFDFKNQSF